jgi:internalin A
VNPARVVFSSSGAPGRSLGRPCPEVETTMSPRRFTLIAVLIVVAIAIVILIRRVGRPAEVAQDSAVQAILDKGGKVERDENAPGRPVTTVRLSRNHVTDADLALLGAFPDLTAVYLVATGVTDDGLKHLRHLRGLRTLDLRVTHVTDVGLKELQHFPELESLNLRETRVTDEGLKELAVLKNLRSLDLTATAVTGAGLGHLRGLDRLQSAELPPACVTSTGLRKLQEVGLFHLFPGVYAAGGRRPGRPEDIHTLVLHGAPITGDGLRGFKDLPSVRRIQLHPEQVTDEALQALREIGRLCTLDQANERQRLEILAPLADEVESPARDGEIKFLDLSKCPITDAGLAHLKGLDKLETLDLSETKVTARGLAALKELPKLDDLYLPDLELSAADLRPLKAHGNIELHGADIELTDESLKAFRDEGLLHLLLHKAFKVHDLDAGDDPGADDRVEWHLNLSDSPVTDAGLRALKGFHNFTTLELSGTQVTNAGLAELGAHDSLKRLYLDDTHVSDAGLRHLAGLKLDALGLANTGVSDVGIKHLAGVKSLERLNLENTRVTDEGLKELKNLDRLVTLRLPRTQVTDIGLKHLTGLKKLRYLALGKTPVTSDGIQELKVALPKCEIRR